MKNYLFFSFLVLMSPIVAMSSPWFPTLDIDSLAMSGPLSHSEKAILEFYSIQKNLRSALRQENFGDPRVINDLTSFVKAHPGNFSALSAKLYLAYYIAFSRQPFKKSKEKWGQMVKLALSVFKGIADSYPNTWQGKLASTHTWSSYHASYVCDQEALLREFAKVKPVYSELDQIIEFKEFMKTLNLYEPAEAIIVEQEISIFLSKKELEKAKKAFDELRRKFPGSRASMRAENLFSNKN